MKSSLEKKTEVLFEFSYGHSPTLNIWVGGVHELCWATTRGRSRCLIIPFMQSMLYIVGPCTTPLPLSHCLQPNTLSLPSPCLVAIPDIPLWMRLNSPLLVCSVYIERESRRNKSSSLAIIHPSILPSVHLSFICLLTANSCLQHRLTSSNFRLFSCPSFQSVCSVFICVFVTLFLSLPTPA